MLNKSTVIFYVKDTLGMPHVTIEKSDNDIWMYTTMFTLREFSARIPDINEITIDTRSPENQTDVKNKFYIRDPHGCSILNMSKVLLQEQEYLMTGRPYQQPYQNFYGVEAFAVAQEQGSTAEHFSRSQPIYEFITPNIIRLWASSSIPSYVFVQYERSQPEDLSKIPTEKEMDFLYLALADTMIRCGNIRNKYQTISTPYGDVPLDVSLADKGQQLKDRVLEKLDKVPPNVIISVG